MQIELQRETTSGQINTRVIDAESWGHCCRRWFVTQLQLWGVGRQAATALGGHFAAMCNPLDDKDGDCAEEKNVDKAALMQDELFHKPNQR